MSSENTNTFANWFVGAVTNKENKLKTGSK